MEASSNDPNDTDSVEVTVEIDPGNKLPVPIKKAELEHFNALRHAQRVRIGRVWKQLGDDVQLGKEPPETSDCYVYIAASAVQNLRDIWAIVSGSRKVTKTPEGTLEKKEKPRGPRISIDEIINAAIEVQRKQLNVPNWPADVLYLAKQIHQEELRSWHAGSASLELQNPPTLQDRVEIRQITVPSHPAYPGFGLFALRDIPAQVEIGPYTGLHRSKSRNSSSQSVYIAALTADADIDAERVGNEMRFINDYRNTGCLPNVEWRQIRLPSRNIICVVRTTRDVKKGEELLIDYGDEYWKQIERRRNDAQRQLSDSDTETGKGNADAKGDEALAFGPEVIEILEEEVFGRDNPALEWFVREEMQSLQSWRRRSFTIPKRYRSGANSEVFMKLGWANHASSYHQWKVPRAFDLIRFGATYNDFIAQKAAGRKRPAPDSSVPHEPGLESNGLPTANGALINTAKRKRGTPSHEADLPNGYPELQALVYLHQLHKDEVLSDIQVLRYKTTLLRNLELRFS